MKKVSLVLAAAAAWFSMAAHAEVLDLNLGHNSFRGDFSGALSRFLPGTVGQYDIGVVERPRSSEHLTQAHGGLLVTGDAGLRDINLTAGLGGRLLYVNREGDNGGALALGGQLNARLPQIDRVGLNFSSYYAPGVTSFGRLDRYWENAIDVEYELIRDGGVYAGYRNIRQDIGSFSGSVDNGFHLGFRLKF